MLSCFLGLFIVPAGKQGTFSFEVSCKAIPGGHYVIVVNGYPREGSYTQAGDVETLSVDNVYMRAGTGADIKLH